MTNQRKRKKVLVPADDLHGTNAMYHKERRAGETPCDAVTAAHSAQATGWYQNNPSSYKQMYDRQNAKRENDERCDVNSSGSGNQLVDADIVILHAMNAKLEAVKDRIGDAVRQAREDGASWNLIADTLGISAKQVRKEYMVVPEVVPGQLTIDDVDLELVHEDDERFELQSEAEYEAAAGL